MMPNLASLALVLALMGASEDPRLVTAAKGGDTETLNSLLDQGADVNVQAGDGSTALVAIQQPGHGHVPHCLCGRITGDAFFTGK